MVKFFLGIYDYFCKRRHLCMGILMAVVMALVAMVSTLRYNENIYDFLPLSGDDQKAITLYQDISGGQRIVAMFHMADEKPDETGQLTEAIDTFAFKLSTGSGRRHIKNITTQVDFEKFNNITQFIYQNMPLMLSDTDYVRMEKILTTPEAIDESLGHDVEMMMMPATGFFSQNISSDPLGLFTPVMERLQSRQAQMPFDIDNGYIFTADHKYAVVMLTSPYGAMESANNRLLVNYVDSVAQATMNQYPAVKISTTGSPVIAVGNAQQIKTDSQWAISIAVTLILLLLIFSLRGVKNILLVGAGILFGWLFAMGFIAVLRNNVSLIVLGIGSIIIGIAVNYPLHFVAHTAHGGKIRDVLKDMIEPLLIGNITTIGAFAALLPLDAPALRDLGLFAAFMLLGTILFVLIFLPHLVTEQPSAKKEYLLFGRLSMMTPKRSRPLVWGLTIITLVLGYFSLKISFDANMSHVNYMTDEQKKLLSDLHAAAGINDTTNVYIVTEGKTWDHALKERRQMSAVIDSISDSHQLTKYSDVTSFISSKEEQQQRIDRWNKFWQRHRGDVLRQLASRAPAYGFSSDAFNDFASIIQAHYAPHDFSYFEPIKSVLLNNSFSRSTGSCSVVDVVSVKNKSDLQQVEDRLNAAVGVHGYVFDFEGMNSAVANSLSDNFNYIGFACGFIVFFFLWASFGRFELSALTFLPMGLGWIWILGLMYLFGMQFNIVNIILATFIFGQGDDYTIFMTDGLINEFAYKKKLLPSFKNSIIVSALIMFIGMGSLIVARHPALHSLAEVTIVGMFTTVVMAWVVPPLIFGWLVKTDGKVRLTPITTGHVIRTMYCTVVYLFELSYGCVIGFFVRLLPDKNRQLELWFHKVIYKTMRVNISHIQGIKSVLSNPVGEKFTRGSIMICNHQSILDPVYLLALHPKVIILVSGKNWRNPIVHGLFSLAGFIRLDQPFDALKDQIKQAVDNGYNVAFFPEGKRTDGTIERFQRGAFQIAQETEADILPVFLHGAGHVMPKGSGFASRGRIDLEIGRRVSSKDLAKMGETPLQIAKTFREMYLSRYKEMCRRIENSHYFHDYIIYKYIYKGITVERETRRLLKEHNDFSDVIDNYSTTNKEDKAVHIVEAGKGQFALLFALVHPELEVHCYSDNEDDCALIACCDPLPGNLHAHLSTDRETFSGKNVINEQELINRKK